MSPRKRSALQDSSLANARAAKLSRTSEPDENDDGHANAQLRAALDEVERWRTAYNESQECLCSALCTKKTAQQDVRRKTTTINNLKQETLRLKSEKTQSDADANTAKHNANQLQQRLKYIANSLDQVNIQYSGALCRVVSLANDLENSQREVTRLRQVKTTLRTELVTLRATNHTQKRELKKFRAREDRAKHAQPANPQKGVVALRKGRKAGGELRYKTEIVIIELVRLGIPSSQVFRTIMCCAKLFDSVVLGDVSESTVRSVILAAGGAGRLQIADAMVECETATFSSDSTSHKSISYLASHITTMKPNTPERPNEPQHPTILALPITTLDNHTSQGQLNTIVNIIREVLGIYMRCFRHD
jgi:hypothetical protein